VPARCQSQYLAAGIQPERPPRPGDGCPSHPAHADFSNEVRAAVSEMMATLRTRPLRRVLDADGQRDRVLLRSLRRTQSPPGLLPYCRKEFVKFVQSFGVTLEDFGAKKLG